MQGKPAANIAPEGIHTDVEQGCYQNQHHRAVKPDILNGAVYIEPKRVDAQNPQNRRFPHDDFPTIEQKRQKVQEKANDWKYPRIP